MSIDWTEADRNEWRCKYFGPFARWCVEGIESDGDSYSITDRLDELAAREIVVLHNYRLAQRRRPKWKLFWDAFVVRFINADGLIEVTDPFPNELAAMEFTGDSGRGNASNA